MLSLSKKLALGTYYYAGLPLRVWNNLRRISTNTAPVMVVFYHRIADTVENSWTAHRAVFRQHIDWLQSHVDVVSLSEAQRRIASGRNSRPCVAITFDDGYAENCDFAIPLLVERNLPCTYFVTSGNVLKNQAFPHDRERGRALPPNTPQQIRQIAELGIEIGAHTRTHADLGAITNPRQLESEVIGSVKDLEDMTGMPVRYFAFPYGQRNNLNPVVFSLAREHGLLGICSAYGAYNKPGDDPFHLQRIHADNDLLRFKNWLTVDPRKLFAPKYDYHVPAMEVDEVAIR
jgi:peptidoglycan/xylan/chitin deacetylase (PgdA/CDA1 family)